ncbi:MAG: hypothetical protein D6696_04060, partial [Acidobacteria bacterium]
MFIVRHPTTAAGIRNAAWVFLAAVLVLPPAARAQEARPAPWSVLRASYYDADTKIAVRPEIAAKSLPQTATFEVDFVGFSPDAQAAFQRAVDIWSSLVTSPVPIRIQAVWTPLGPGILGGAGAQFIHRDFTGAAQPGTWYVDALADAQAGMDLNPGFHDIVAQFNSSFGQWYFGTDGNPGPGLFDLVTVVLHEIGHGLGFTGSFTVDQGGVGSWGLTTGIPFAYDTFAEDGSGTSLLDENAFPNNSVAVTNVLQSDDVFFNGPNLNLANNGQPAPLFAPNPFLQGSSFSHFDENAYPPGNPGSLMTPFLAQNEVIHDADDLALCLFEDLGWDTAAQCGGAAPTCVPSATAICLNDDRFRVELEWVFPSTGEKRDAGVVPFGSD